MALTQDDVRRSLRETANQVGTERSQLEAAIDTAKTHPQSKLRVPPMTPFMQGKRALWRGKMDVLREEQERRVQAETQAVIKKRQALDRRHAAMEQRVAATLEEVRLTGGGRRR
ncbi:hypothetical protein [uncultured Selenomonas sp.]|uniref:hypothetical protein n=1 Tax=uncultured Selenomonas sp. TaxID=159275 RepID=UPI0025E86F77|nr:hypothetical protein [uncultured Selenomonas sp.]